MGVDQLGMSAVARRAGLTTGALYSRYENVAELAAAVWTQRIAARHHALLDSAVGSIVDGGASVDRTRLLDELRVPSQHTVVGLELLATARRIDELEEVVFPDVQSWMASWRAGPRTRSRRRRAQIIYTLGSLWGGLLHAIPGDLHLDWEPILSRLAWSFRQPYEGHEDRLVADPVQPIRANTGDPAHNALLDAVSTVVARVGLHRATASRIARRAGVTPGSIYSRYETKEDLLEHAVDVLLGRRFADDLATNSYAFTTPDPGTASARIIAGYLSPPRREWRRFRIETWIASRQHPRLASTLHRTQEDAIRRYLEILGAHTPEEQAALEILARGAQAIPLGLAFADLVVEDATRIDWRIVLEPLFSPE